MKCPKYTKGTPQDLDVAVAPSEQECFVSETKSQRVGGKTVSCDSEKRPFSAQWRGYNTFPSPQEELVTRIEGG